MDRQCEERLGVGPCGAVLFAASATPYNTMSKPKFQTDWEEIDEEYQQLQVTVNAETSPLVSG